MSSVSSSSLSPSCQAALDVLRQIKPQDGWSIQRKDSSKRLVRLLRRNVPLTDNYFLDIHYDAPTKNVVGILTGISNNSKKVQAQVLVDGKTGKPTDPNKKINLVTVSGYSAAASNTFSRRSTTTTTTNMNTASSSTTTTSLTDAQNRDLLKYGGAAIAAAVAFRLLFVAFFGLYLLAFPAAVLYLLYTTCPDPNTFDAKKELKRTLRGHYLPDDHPDKPKGFLSETVSRIQASLTTEMATLPGYEVTVVNLAGAAVVASVRVPAVDTDYYWIGAAHRWWYITGVQLNTNNSNNRSSNNSSSFRAS